jgi:hypothetical protein
MQPRELAPFFIITHSLGSKILADALYQAPLEVDDASRSRSAHLPGVHGSESIAHTRSGSDDLETRWRTSVVNDVAMNALIVRIIGGRSRNRGPCAVLMSHCGRRAIPTIVDWV